MGVRLQARASSCVLFVLRGQVCSHTLVKLSENKGKNKIYSLAGGALGALEALGALGALEALV